MFSLPEPPNSALRFWAFRCSSQCKAKPSALHPKPVNTIASTHKWSTTFWWYPRLPIAANAAFIAGCCCLPPRSRAEATLPLLFRSTFCMLFDCLFYFKRC